MMTVSTQTSSWFMLLKMVSSTYHNLLSFYSPKGYFRMFSLEMTHLVSKTTWWNHTHSIVYLLQREYLITVHQEQEESLKMSLGLLQVVSLSSIDQLSLYKERMIAKPTTVISITRAIVALPNFLMLLNSNDNYSYCPPGFVDQDHSSEIIEGEWRREK